MAALLYGILGDGELSLRLLSLCDGGGLRPESGAKEQVCDG